MKKKNYVVRIIALILVITLTTPIVSAVEFNDISGHWAEEDVRRWTAVDVIRGYEDKTFKPNNPITRGEMATIVDRILQFEKLGKNVFSDLDNPKAFYYAPLLMAYDAKIFLGDDLRRMRPKDYITRQEAVTILGRAFGVKISDRYETPCFKDYHYIADWAIGYVEEMAAKAYVAGRPDGTFDPKADITRGEIARILNNMFLGYFNKAGEYSENIAGTAIINTSNVVLKNMTIRGDLIIAEGVKDGEVTLDGVTVLGEVFVRGGGPNSVLIKSNTNIGSLSVGRTAGPVSVKIIDPASVNTVDITPRSGDVTLYGTIKSLNIDAPLSKVTAYRANIGQVHIRASQSDFMVDNYSKIGQIVVDSAAENTKLDIHGRVSDVTLNGKGGTLSVSGIVSTVTTAPATNEVKIIVTVGGGVGTLDISGTNSTVFGDGRIESIFVKGNNTTIQAVGSQLMVSPIVVGTVARGLKISAGANVKLEGNLPYAKDPETGAPITGAITKVTITPMTPYVTLGSGPITFTAVLSGTAVANEAFKWHSSNELVGRISTLTSTTDPNAAGAKALFYPLSIGTTQITVTGFDGSTGLLNISVVSKEGVCMIGDIAYSSLSEAIDEADLSNMPTTINLLPKFYDGKEVLRIGPTTNSQELTIVGTGKISAKPYTGGISITRPNTVLQSMNLVVSAIANTVPLAASTSDQAPPRLAAGAPHPTPKPPATNTTGVGDKAGIYVGADHVTIKNSTIDVRIANNDYAIYGIFVDEKLSDPNGYTGVSLVMNTINAINSGTNKLAYGIYSLSPKAAITTNTITSFRALGMERLTAKPEVVSNLFNATDYDVVYHGPDTFINSAVAGEFSTIFGGDKNLNLTSKELLSEVMYQLRGSKTVLLANSTRKNVWERFEYFDYSNPLVLASYYYNRSVVNTWELTDLAAFEAAKLALTQSIAKAMQSHAAAIEGTYIGEYPAPAKAEVKVAIDSASKELANLLATTSTIKAATSALDTAFATFLDKQVKPTPASSFLTANQTGVFSGSLVTLSTYPNKGETVWLAPAGSKITDLNVNENDPVISKNYGYNRTLLLGTGGKEQVIKAPRMPGNYKIFVVYENQIVGVSSINSVTVVKEPYPANEFIPSVPKALSITDSKITLETVNAQPSSCSFPHIVQYAKSILPTAPTEDNKWQESPTFDKLERDTEYYFFTRIKTTETHLASAASAASAPVRTLKTEITDIAKHADPKLLLVNGETIQAPSAGVSTLTTVPATSALVPTWTAVAGSASVEFGVTQASDGNVYTFWATYTAPGGYKFVQSAATMPQNIEGLRSIQVSQDGSIIIYEFAVTAIAAPPVPPVPIP